jgi:hypothetical protein
MDDSFEPLNDIFKDLKIKEAKEAAAIAWWNEYVTK